MLIIKTYRTIRLLDVVPKLTNREADVTNSTVTSENGGLEPHQYGTTYIIYRPAGSTYDFASEAFELVGDEVERVKQSLLLFSGMYFGADGNMHALFSRRLLMTDWIDAELGHSMLPVFMDDEKLNSLIWRRTKTIADAHAHGQLTTLEYVAELHAIEDCYRIFDFYQFIDVYGMSLEWVNRKMRPYTYEATFPDLRQEDLNGTAHHPADARQIEELDVTHFFYQYEMHAGKPSRESYEHKTYGQLDEAGEFIPLVTMLNFRHPALVGTGS